MKSSIATTGLPLRARLLSSTALVVVGAVWLASAGTAQAVPSGGSCVTTTPGGVTTITCSGFTNDQVYAGDDHSVVTLNADATVAYDYDPAILLGGNGASLTLKANSAVNGYGGALAVVAYGDNNTITLNDGATIENANTLYGDGNYAAVGIYADTSGGLTLNGGSSVVMNGGTDNNYYDGNDFSGVYAEGKNIGITLNGASTVAVNGIGTAGNNKYFGIKSIGTATTAATRSSIVLNGASRVDVVGSRYNSDGNDLTGIYAASVKHDTFAPTVVLNGGSSVNVAGHSYTSSNKYEGIYSTGINARVTLNGGSSVNVTGDGDATNKYLGVLAYGIADGAGSRAASVTLNGGSSVNVTSGSDSSGAVMGGIVAKGYLGSSSVALNGGSTVSLTNHGDTAFMVGIENAGTGSVTELNGGSSVEINAYGGGSSGKYLGVFAFELAGQADKVGHITLNAGSSVNVRGGYSTSSKYVGVSSWIYGPGKYASDVTLNNSHVSVLSLYGTGNTDVGIMVLGNKSTVTLNGSSDVLVSDEYGDGYAVGLLANGSGTSVVLNDTSRINVGGYGSSSEAYGIAVNGDDVSITMNDSSSVSAGDSYSGSPLATGIVVRGNNNVVTLNGDARVETYSTSGDGHHGGVVLGYGADSSLTLNGNASITTYSSSGNIGVNLDQMVNSSVTLNGTSSVYAQNSVGIFDNSGLYNTINVGSGTSVVGEVGIVSSGDFTEINISGFVGTTDTYAIYLSGTNNTVTLNSATINGRMRGGFANDHLVLEGAGVLNDAFFGFDTLDVNASGIWNVAGYGSADSVVINSGTLAVNGALYASSGVTVKDGGTLGGSGVVNGVVTVEDGGTLAPGNSPGTLNIVGNTTFNSGSNFAVQVEGPTADLLNVDGDVTVDPGAVLTPQFIGGVDGFVGDVLTVTGGHAVTGTFVIGNGGAADYTDPTKVSLTAVSSSSMNGGLSAGASTGFTFLDTVLGQAEKGIGRNHNLWAAALWHHSDRTADGNTRGFSQKGMGGAFGGNVMETGNMTLGLAGGYVDSDAVTVGGGTTTKIKGYHVAAYTSYGMGATKLTGAVTAAYQDQDVSRNVFSLGTIVRANSAPEAWLVGAGLGIGHDIPLGQGFTLTPKASIGWQHMTRDSLTESGGGLGGMSVGEITTDTMRGQAGAELSLMVRDPNAMWSVRPHINAGLAQEWRGGDENARGTFTTTGAAFNAALDTRDQTYLAVGAGVDMTLGGGITGFLSYDGGFGGDAEKSGGVRLGARFEW